MGGSAEPPQNSFGKMRPTPTSFVGFFKRSSDAQRRRQRRIRDSGLRIILREPDTWRRNGDRPQGGGWNLESEWLLNPSLIELAGIDRRGRCSICMARPKSPNQTNYDSPFHTPLLTNCVLWIFCRVRPRV